MVKNSPEIVFIRLNSFRSEPRLIKEYNSAKKRFNCKMLLWNLDQQREDQEDAISLNLYLPFGSFWLKPAYLIWFGFCQYHLFRLQPKIIHACDFEGNLIARFYHFFSPRTKVVCDIYDVSADKYSLPPKSFLRDWLRKLERSFAARADYLIIPDEERLDQLGFTQEEQRNLKYAVVYNSDYFPSRKEKTEVSFKGRVELVYVGVLSKEIRGLEQLVYIAENCPSAQITIAGFGVDQDYFKELFQQKNLPNLKFVGRVSFTEAKSLFEHGDIIVSILSPAFNNYRFASSTKVFDAFAANKPIITTTGTATASVVKAANWGSIIDYNQESLLRLIEQITTGRQKFTLDPSLVAQYDWQRCEGRLNQIYDQLLNER